MSAYDPCSVTKPTIWNEDVWDKRILFKDPEKILQDKTESIFFGFRTVNMWNGLPDDVVLSPTLNSFKGRIDRHWRSLRYSVFWLCPLVIWLNGSDLISPKANNGLIQPWLQHDDDDDDDDKIQIASHIYVQHKVENNYCYTSCCLLIDSDEIDSQISAFRCSSCLIINLWFLVWVWF